MTRTDAKRMTGGALVALVFLLLVWVGAAWGQSGTVDCRAGDAALVTLHEGDLSWLCATTTPVVLPTGTPTHLPTNTSTATATVGVISTGTPTPTATNTPKPTQATVEAPTPGATMTPFAAAAACATHDDTAWHGLWDGVRGCHYGHTHNWDPAIVAGLFGQAGALVGQEISYPWRTPNEQERKHSGYKYGVNRDLPCEFDFAGDLATSNCVRAFSLQYHSHLLLDPTVRFHSFFAQGLLCTQDGTRCGTMATGGWIDSGFLQSPYKVAHVPLPGIDPPGPVDLNEEPYKAFNRTNWGGVDFVARYRQPFRSCKGCPADRNSVNDNVSFWGTDEPWSSNYGYNLLAGYDTWTYDTAVLISVTAPFTPTLICPAGNCRFNNSEELVYLMAFRVPTSLDTNGDGFVTYSGYTDVRGQIVTGCTGPGANCVPLVIEDAPVGLALWSKQDELGYTIPQPDGTLGPPEFDVSPGSVWWIDMEHH